MNRRRTLINALLTFVVILYIVIMVPVTNRAERNDTFSSLRIQINDSNGTGFLKEADIHKILNQKYSGFDTLRRKHLNTLEVERLLATNNRVENSACRILNDGTLLITVDPLNPVARVFDREGSVYVNAAGKRVKSEPSFHVDVPVVTTNSVADSVMVNKLLPLLTAIKNDKSIDALVSSLRFDDRGDIIIIPNIVGHVINFGDASLIDNKFARLRVFYRDVMPVRGWNAFDSISVKWNGRIVATKRDKTVPQRVSLLELDSIVEEVLADEVMSVEI